MEENWTIGAQLSTSHSSLAALSLDRMLDAVERVRALIDLDLLVIGSREAPDIFRGFTGARRPVEDVFLWYGVLSDIEGFEESDLVVNWRGERSHGWGGWAEKARSTKLFVSHARTIRPRASKRASTPAGAPRVLPLLRRLSRQDPLSLASQWPRGNAIVLLRSLPPRRQGRRSRSRRRRVAIRGLRH